ncbi:MAG: T9SS type A sorting domain-containing protein, partial [Chitinophagaceae bacterium]|nr:T9SS type A sorting domain-containing protein [Chitinophagaceae bacterium]
DKNVGNGKTVTLTGATLSGSEAGNYNLVSVNTTLADINQKQITVALIGTVTKMYDANNIATLVTGNYSLPGIIGTDDVVLNNPTSGLYNNKHVGTGKNVVVTGLSISGADAGNYALTSTSANANIGVITIRPVNVTAQTDSRIYNGTNSSSVSPVGEALQGSDTYTTLGTQTYNNKHVASGKIMIATGAVINDGNGGLNYSITYVTNNTGVIIVKPINVTAQTDNRMYNGTNSSSVSPVGDALQTGDSYTTQGTQTYNDKHVATGKTMTATGTIINDGNSGNNYFITYVTNTTGVITIRPITVTAITNTKVYDGNTSALAVPTFPPLQTGDVVSTQPTEVYDNPLVGTGKTMTASGLMINDGNGGNNYSISYVQNFTGVINLASTTTTLTTSAGVVRFMDYLTMTATIKPLNTGTPLTGTVEFKIGTVSYGSATVVPIPGATDGSVQAMMIKQVTNMPLASPGYTVTATFTSSNTNYAGSNDSKQLTVNPRNASPNNASGFYTGDGFAWTTGPNTSTATVTMTAVIKDPNSPTGDVRGAKASFFLVNGTTMSPISSAQNLPVGLIDVTDGSVGSASAIVQLNIGSLNSNSFQIAVKITGAYTNNPWDALSQTIVTVSKPVTGGYICGGSTMKNTSSSGYIKGATDLNTDFQFDIQYNSSGTNPKGKVNVLVRSYYDRFGILDSKLHKYFIKTSAIALLAISNPLATGTFSAKANMEEQLDDGTVISVESGATFQMVAFQNGCTQQIAITYHRKAGGIWFSSKWNAATSKTELQNVNTGSKVYVAGGGSCSVASRTNGLANSTQVDVIPQTADLQFNVKVFGNPTLSTFKLQLQSSNTTEKITVKVYDINGRVVELRQQLLAGQMIELGSAYKQGTYFAEVIQGDQRKVVKLIKTAQN